MQRSPEEELEYRRYLRRRIAMRKRRRKVRMIRAVLGTICVALVFLLVYKMSLLVMTGSFSGDTSSQKTEVSQAPAVTAQPEIPEGYEEVYEKLSAMAEEHEEINDILLNLVNYPKDLLELAANNEETISFVSNYLKHIGDEKSTGSITAEELSLGIPLLQQWDQRWGYVTYGSNIVAINGCGPTCMSMVYAGLTKNVDKTPADMADFCIENSYYAADSGTSWMFMTEGAKKLGLNAEKITVNSTTITECLNHAKPVICSMMPGDFTTTGHFIVLRGITKEGRLLINDPNNIARSNQEWDMDTVLSQVRAAWAYSVQ